MSTDFLSSIEFVTSLITLLLLLLFGFAIRTRRCPRLTGRAAGRVSALIDSTVAIDRSRD